MGNEKRLHSPHLLFIELNAERVVFKSQILVQEAGAKMQIYTYNVHLKLFMHTLKSSQQWRKQEEGRKCNKYY